jgi:voltage-dependent calcium channel L type alpha-1D
MGVANPEQMHKKIMCIDFNSAWCFHSVEWAKAIVEHPYFDPLVISLILVNTLVLSLYKYPQEDEELCVLDTIGFVLTIFFTCEMTLKLLGIGLFEYLNDGFNCVDGFIVLLSLVELGMAPPACFTGTEASGTGGAFSAMRTVRLFRIFKLMSSWKGLRRMVNVVIGMLSASVNLGMLLLLFMYIFSILGMEFFATKLHFDDNGYALHWNDTAYADSESPRINFDDFWSAFLTVFQILSGEDWNVVMYTARRGGGPPSPSFTSCSCCSSGILSCSISSSLSFLMGWKPSRTRRTRRRRRRQRRSRRRRRIEWKRRRRSE